VVAERLEPGKIQRKDMLGSFLAHGLTREEAEAEAMLQIVAGSDTTATAIRMTLLHLISSPLSYQALAHEIRTAASEGKISAPISEAEIKKLPYLQAVVKESIRIWPPVTGPSTHMVPEGGLEICGKYIPGGTEISWATLAVLHDKTMFGQDSGIFRPERWLGVSPERLKDMSAQLDLVFRAGKWQCLGKPVALLELHKIFVEVRIQTQSFTSDLHGILMSQPYNQLLRRYDFTIVNPAQPLKTYNSGLFMQSDLFVRVTRVEGGRALKGPD
jgi:cytochrome P450